MTEFAERRGRNAVEPFCEMVTPREFLALMISHHEYVREDNRSAQLLGLRNRRTGNCLYVPAEELEKERRSFLQIN